MLIHSHVFREYDIRGTVGVDLNEDFAYLLGRAYAELALEHGKDQIAVGYDARLSSPKYAGELLRGLADGGVNCFATGMGPTPQLYFSVFARNLGGGIQVTGSHNPPDMNGFKLCLGTNTLSGAQIQDLRSRMERLNSNLPEARSGEITELEIRGEYTQYIINNCHPHMGKRKLKIVCDAGNGVGGLVGPEALRALGIEVTELYCEPDGNFPAHHPDPTVLENIRDLIEKVRETNSDFGIAYDGDADRIGVVDENGSVIYGDMLLLIFGLDILRQVPNATIIGDVKCSDLLFSELEKHGAKAVMYKTGHSLIKGKLKELNAELAGEMSAHIFFKHRYFGFDDAIYASARLCEILSNTDQALSQLLGDIPKTVTTPEIRVDCPEELKFKVIENAQSLFSGYQTNTIDGIRIRFENGWGLVRASNTQPVLVMRFEAQTPEQLNQYRSIVEEKIALAKSKVS